MTTFNPSDTLPSELIINGDKQILRNTDYNLLKAFEHILYADSLDELMIRIRYAREQYENVIAQRQLCRDEINEAEISLVQEEKEREQEMLRLAEQRIEEI